MCGPDTKSDGKQEVRVCARKPNRTQNNLFQKCSGLTAWGDFRPYASAIHAGIPETPLHITVGNRRKRKYSILASTCEYHQPDLRYAVYFRLRGIAAGPNYCVQKKARTVSTADIKNFISMLWNCSQCLFLYDHISPSNNTRAIIFVLVCQ